MGWWSIQATRIAADRYLGFATDITARKLAEEELLHEREFRQSLLDAAPVIVLVLDPQGHIVYLNRFLEELCGYSLAEVRGADWFATFLPERHRTEVRSLFATAISRAPTRGYHNYIVTRDGADRLIEWNDECLPSGDGQVAGLLAIGLDVTERRHTQFSLRAKKQELRESEERLRLALASANQGLWDIHVPTGEVIVSPEYATMLGFDPTNFRESESDWINRLHPDDRSRAAEDYRRYVTGKLAEYCTEFRLRTRTGNWKWVLSKGRIVSRDAQGKPLRMIGTHTDITRLKEVEESLTQRRHRSFDQRNGNRRCGWPADVRQSGLSEDVGLRSCGRSARPISGRVLGRTSVGRRSG
jgi:PAS domain S-box-containing protein